MLILALALAAAPAVAAPTVHVRIDDLDLSKPVDIARLHRRVAGAAAALCPPLEAPAPLERRAQAMRCQAAALASAAPRLAALTAPLRFAHADAVPASAVLAAR